MKRWIGLLILVVVVAGGVYGYRMITSDSAQFQAASDGQRIAYYTCPMHPQVHEDHPGDCPICGMRLVPVYEPADTGEKMPVGDASGAMPADETPSHVSIAISAEKQQLIGVRTGAVVSAPLIRTIRTAGRIAYDPVLYSAISEYRSAVETSRAIHGGPFQEAGDQKESQWGARAADIVESTRRRLRLLGLSDAEIERIGSAPAGADYSSLLLRGPEGELWAYAQIYENEAALVKPGQAFEVTLPGDSSRIFRTRVASLDPVVDPMTRTIKVRARIVDRVGVLRPDMYVNVRISVNLGVHRIIPAEAVLHTGERDIVFVDQGGGRFEPREVHLGPRGDDRVAVLHGLRAGERVVISGNFLVDSESRLKAAMQGVVKKQGGSPKDGAPAPAHQH